jgi:hypothetical protein
MGDVREKFLISNLLSNVIISNRNEAKCFCLIYLEILTPIISFIC